MLRAARFALLSLEVVLVSALISATRCANWHAVFVGGEIYFTDADCYARMTRARICDEHPGTVVRQHEFENFPAGTTPHTTAPFDYAIVALAACVRPFTGSALEIAGAFVSSLLALIGGCFLWWWMRRMRFRWRIVGLLLYATSPMIAHATELGRPDHQSLVLILVLIAACAEWSLRVRPSRAWSIVAGAAWALALWVSAYEPLVLLVVVVGCSIRTKFPAARWTVFTAMLASALLIERRLFVLPEIWREQRVANWLATIGEMRGVPVFSATWFDWCGLFMIAAPILIAFSFRRRTNPPLVIVLLLIVSFAATLLQVRWGYFFAGLLAIIVPSLLASVRANLAAVVIALIGFVPILRAWDASIWPNEPVLAARVENRNEMRDLRAVAEAMITSESTGFIAPWWLSPAIAYWSGNSGVAGSSHESIDGIIDTARFYLARNDDTAREILSDRNVRWVIASDAERVAQNSAAVLTADVAPGSLAFTLARTPSRARHYLTPAYQTGTCTLFSVQNSR